MIDYRLHVFRQVAEVRSLTKASKVLHLSQPAVSKHIKLLEEELRVPLFVRSSSGVVLTDAGTIFLKHVRFQGWPIIPRKRIVPLVASAIAVTNGRLKTKLNSSFGRITAVALI
jgi:DNA-binding transcriptional ArsR family regulator